MKITRNGEQFVPQDIFKQPDGSVTLKVGCEKVSIDSGALDALQKAPMRLQRPVLVGGPNYESLNYKVSFYDSMCVCTIAEGRRKGFTNYWDGGCLPSRPGETLAVFYFRNIDPPHTFYGWDEFKPGASIIPS